MVSKGAAHVSRVPKRGWPLPIDLDRPSGSWHSGRFANGPLTVNISDVPFSFRKAICCGVSVSLPPRWPTKPLPRLTASDFSRKSRSFFIALSCSEASTPRGHQGASLT